MVILLDARDYWARMQKSLGEKRKLLTKGQIDQITELYVEALTAAADPDHPEHSKVKVLTNQDFGYQRIAVDRPLRQRFEITEDTVDTLVEAKALARYDERDNFIEAVKSLIGTVWKTRKNAREGLQAALGNVAAAWPVSTIEKAIWAAVGVSDSSGELQTRKGEPVPDPDLRSYENIPLGEDIDEYLTSEILPHVPDAWIAEVRDPATGGKMRAKIGYEIPFTRYFYTYNPPRSLTEIDAELGALELQVQALIARVTNR
jgi:type I restriction enzyme M protein